MGRLDGEHVRREVRAREAARLQGQDHERHRGHAVLPGDAGRQGRRRARGLGQHAGRVGVSRTSRTSPSASSARTGSPASSAGTSRGTCSSSTRRSRRGGASRARRAIFKSPESGSQGMFLGGDPSYVQKDRALIKELGLNLKHVVAGAEPAQVARWSAAVQAEEARALLLVRPAVPERAVRPRASPAAEALRRAAWTTRSRPASTRASTRRTGSTSSSAESSRRAARPRSKFVKKWKWTSADQNFVANLIAGKKMKPDKAAEQWVKANKAKVNAWLK